MNTIKHIHTAACWKRYEACGEHHAHTFDCGGGELLSVCPEYENDLWLGVSVAVRSARPHLKLIQRNAEKLGDDVLVDAVKNVLESEMA